MALPLWGCEPVASLHPLWISANQIVFDQALLGTWAAVNAKDRATLSFQEADEGRGYQVVWSFMDSENRLRRGFYRAYLVQLGDQHFLDVSPDIEAESSPPLLSSYVPFVPRHFFLRATTAGDSLQLAYLEGDSLFRKIEQGAVRIAHETVSDEPSPFDNGSSLVLTANSNDLQALVRAHPDAFVPYPDESGTWRRQR